ncbi:hypothetical protein [Bathymodiolus platifrons methanotrophic gill symbiont]|uniref:hypothetical protein n=1 Tax=Bathymodiolus platifrons methanotrophic gill symbiont TaxID=113268 RepID=UPI0011C975F4|nr:hypothetical protein [Bathymodiolus platifrons methanotrophic gill symbiont]
MHRTQIYFEELLFADVKRQANNLGLSLSAYIRKTLEKDLEERKKNPQTLDFSGSRYFCESLFWASQPKQAAKT